MDGSTIRAWIDGKPLDEIEFYVLIEYHDKSRTLEIHMPDCQYLKKLVLLQEGKEVFEYENHWVMGPLEKAETRAARIVAEENRPSGWKRAECCFK